MSVTGAEHFGRLRQFGVARRLATIVQDWSSGVGLAAIMMAGFAAIFWLGLVAVLGPAFQAVRTEASERAGTHVLADVMASSLLERLEPTRRMVARLSTELLPLMRTGPPASDAIRRVLAAARAAGLADGALVRDMAVFAADATPLVAGAAELGRIAAQAADQLHIADEGYFASGKGIALVRAVRDDDGATLGVLVAALDNGWLERFAGATVGQQVSGLLLFAPPGRPLFRAGTLSLSADSPMAAQSTVLPAELDIRVERDPADAVSAGGWTSVAWIILIASPGVALLLASAVLVRRRLAELEAAGQLRERRVAELAGASERLSRLRDPIEVAARGEALARGLLDCDEVRVLLGRAPPEPVEEAVGVERQSVNLVGSNGERLGRMTVCRGSDRPFSSADELVLDQVSRAVAAALESANLLADAMNAKSEVELILSTISDGVFTLDRYWCVRYVNNAALRYLQRSREEMLGATLWSLFPGLREGEAGERIEFAIRTAQDVDFSANYQPLNAWYEMRCYPFAGGLTVYFRDVTAQRETEEKLRQSQKLEALGQLTGGIAHDVNNLLTVILGNFEMLMMNAEERRDSGRTDLEMARAGLRAGESASHLMHRLLAFSRRQPLSPQVLEISEMLGSLEPLLRRTIGEQIVLRICWQQSLWRAMVDPVELENAILNLAINARDAMPGGGRLTIEAVNVQIDRVYAAVAGLESTGDFIMLSVADSGIGMTRDVIARAFDPFFTTKHPGQGTGLGLSMVYGFAKQSGGHAMIDSEPGQGTIVRLYLPRTTGAAMDAAGQVDRLVTGGSEAILLVEDNDLVRAHTQAMLIGLGYSVVAAADGPEALQAMEDGFRPALLLTDVVLPGGMTGRDVADSAARLVQDLRVLFTSGYSGSVLLENGGVTSGVELIGKPFRRAELAARIRDQLGGAPWAALRWPAVADSGAAHGES
jgi:signal transduction histidine kinase/CheY-like chemotaxis protein